MLLEELARTFDVTFAAGGRRIDGHHRGSARPAVAASPTGCASRCPIGDDYERVKAKVNALALHTVCKEAICPNIAECWGAGTATIMILGDLCTRGCRFCNVKTGNPRGEIDWLEPIRVAEAVRDLGWKYLVSRQSTATISPTAAR